MTLPNIDAAQSGSSYRDVPNVSCGFARSGDALKRHFSDLVVSKQKLRRVDAIACVRLKRQADSCKATARWPIPARGRNGHFLLQVTGHPSYGLPWGQDRLVPIFLATLAIRQQNRVNRLRSAAQMLATFGTQQGGT